MTSSNTGKYFTLRKCFTVFFYCVFLYSKDIFHSKCEICPEDIFVLASRGVTRGHRFKIVHERFSLDCRRRSFALRVASTWNSLPVAVAAPETLGSFKRAIRC